MPMGADAGPSAVIGDFSLFAGGPLYRIARRLGVVRGESTLLRLGVWLALLAWLPLLALAAPAGLTAIYRFAPGSAALPFVQSLGAHARFLVAIPLFFATEAWTGPRLRGFLGQIVESQLVLPQDVASLDRAIVRATRLRDSAIAEILLVGLTVITMTLGVRSDLPGDASTWRTAGGVLTWAGRWYGAVSLPMFQFLCWRWCWRLVIWTMLLWRVSRLNLQLVPTHPDLAGGLGYLSVAQSYFGTFALAISAVFSASFAEQVLSTGEHLQVFLPLIAGSALITLVVFLGPLLFFTPRLLDVKRRGLKEYGVVAAAYTHQFESKWVHGHEAQDKWLGSPDIQSLSDLANSFAVVRNMRLIPCGPAFVLMLVLSATGPMIPLLLFEFSFEELLQRLVKVLMGV